MKTFQQILIGGGLQLRERIYIKTDADHAFNLNDLLLEYFSRDVEVDVVDLTVRYEVKK